MDAQRIESMFVGVGSLVGGALLLVDPHRLPAGFKATAERLGKHRRLIGALVIAAGVLILATDPF